MVGGWWNPPPVRSRVNSLLIGWSGYIKQHFYYVFLFCNGNLGINQTEHYQLGSHIPKVSLTGSKACIYNFRLILPVPSHLTHEEKTIVWGRT